jgi:Domain of unknown function (DUF3482)/50S ribosome-binding GTPase
VITLSLVSHTNAGKTTLARTLLGRDVGEVRDAPHVTTEASAHPLIETGDGALVLWDTPGFGDSARLAKRLALEGNPIGWFLTQVWDRFRDRAFFLTQRAVRNVREEADVVLYLVNAGEDPADAGYLAPELAILAWMRKPVLVLLNQTGPVHGDDDIARWRRALVAYPQVRGVMALDAFARCWVQELILFDAIGDALPPARKPEFDRLAAAWQVRRFAQFDASITALAQVVASAACARAVVPRTAVLRKIGTALGLGDDAAKASEADAARVLASDVNVRMREAMDTLIAQHGLTGRAAADVESRLADDIAREGPVDEGKAAAVGGVLSGAMTGLAADLAAGGLTFGAGMLTGAVLGALGGAGIARAFNVARGQTDETIRFDDGFVARLATNAMLRYLAVAHYGRGRGAFVESEAPAIWRGMIETAMTARRERFASILAMRSPDCDAQVLADALQDYMREVVLSVLDELYPGALNSGQA